MKTPASLTESRRVSRVAWPGRLAGSMVFVGALALGAHARIPLPWTPVPMTLQTLMVLFFPALLGPWWGMAGVSAYLLLGIFGCPCFALVAGSGLYLLGPTGGYLTGFLVAAFVVGRRAHRRPRAGTVLLAMLAGEIAILALGALQLNVVVGGGWRWAFLAGVWPFLFGDLMKLGLAFGLYCFCAGLSKNWMMP